MINRKKTKAMRCHARQRTDLFKLQVKCGDMDISKYQKYKAHAQTHENMKWAQNHYFPYLVNFAMQNGASPNIMTSVTLNISIHMWDVFDSV